MSTARLIPWEQDIERTLASEIGSLGDAVRNLSKWVGQEIDDVRKESPGPASVTPATVVISSTGAAGSTLGTIAIIQQTVVAGVNRINFTASLSTTSYGGFLVLASADGMLIDSAELRMRATFPAKNGFFYNAPEAGTLYGFALVETLSSFIP